MHPSSLNKIFSTVAALKGISKDTVLLQLNSIFPVKYLLDFCECNHCTDLVALLLHIAKTHPIQHNAITSCTDLVGGAIGGTSRNKKTNLQHLLSSRSLFCIALAISVLGWFEPEKYIIGAVGWDIPYYEVALNDEVEVCSGWWIEGPQKDLISFIPKSLLKDNLLHALRRARQPPSEKGAPPKFTPASSWPNYFAPIFVKYMFDELGNAASTALRQSLTEGEAPIAALELDAIVAAPAANLSQHAASMLAVKRVEKLAWFATTANVDHPIWKLGMIQSGMDFEVYKSLSLALVGGSPTDKEGVAWGTWLWNLLSTPATNADPRYNALLENSAGQGKLQEEVVSLSRYIKTSCRLISYMLHVGLVSLPHFDSVEEPLEYFDRLNAAVLLVTVDDRLTSKVLTFLRLQLITYDTRLATFVPRHISSVSADMAALSYTGKISWSGNYVGMRDSPELLAPRNRTIDGLTLEFSRKIFDGKISESSYVGGIFTLLAQCAKYRDAEAVLKFVPDLEAEKVGKVAGSVDGSYISGDHIVAVTDELLDQGTTLGKKLLGDIHPSIAKALDGDYKIISDDTDNGACKEATFSYSTEPPAGSPVSETIHSSQLNKSWAASLKCMSPIDFNKVKEEYITWGNLLQAAFGCVSPQKRETENSNIGRRNYEGGGTRDLKFMSAFRSDCGTVSRCLVRRTKTKCIGNGKMVFMVSTMTPDLTLQIVFYSGMRDAIFEAWKHHAGAGNVPEEVQTFLFLSSSGLRQRRADGSTNFKAQFAQAHAKVKIAAGALFDDRNVPIGARALRHFAAHALKMVLDERLNINGGSAAAARGHQANNAIMGHSSNMSAMYRDDGRAHNESFSTNTSEIVDFFAICLRFNSIIGFPSMVKGRSLTDSHYDHKRYPTLAAAMNVLQTDDLTVRLLKCRSYLIDNPCFLSLAIGRTVYAEVTWRSEMADAVAEALAHGCSFDGEEATLRHIKLYAPQSRGKTVVPLVLALLYKHLLAHNAPSPPCLVIVYANKYLQEKSLQLFAAAGVEAFGGREAEKMDGVLNSSTGGSAVLLTVIDSLQFLGQRWVLNWIRSGRLKRMFFDEPHEMPAQAAWRPVMAEFVRLCHSPGMIGNVSWTLMTGSANKEVDADLDVRFGIQSAPPSVTTSTLTIPSHFVRNSNVKYSAINSTDFDATAKDVCGRAKLSHDLKKPHIIGVMEKKTATKIKTLLTTLQVECFIHTSEVREEQGDDVVNKVVDSWMNGTSTFFVLITTRPVTGWNNERLVESDWLGAFGLCGASQDGTRVGRSGLTLSHARFHRWEGWSSNFTRDDAAIFVLNVSSFELLFEERCLRRVLALTTELAPTGLAVDLDAKDEANELILHDCSWFRMSATNLASGQEVVLCSACCPAPRRNGLNSPQRASSPSTRRPRTGASSLTDASCQMIAANMEYSNTLFAASLCAFCGKNCGSRTDVRKRMCRQAFAVLKNRCSRCFGGDHLAAECLLVTPPRGCEQICSFCFNVACLNWQHDASLVDCNRFKTQCPNADGNQFSFGFNNLFILTTAIFNIDEDYKDSFNAWMVGRGYVKSASGLANSPMKDKYKWLFESIADIHHATIYNYNLAFCWWWSDYGKGNGFRHNMEAPPSYVRQVLAGDRRDESEDGDGGSLGWSSAWSPPATGAVRSFRKPYAAAVGAVRNPSAAGVSPDLGGNFNNLSVVVDGGWGNCDRDAHEMQQALAAVHDVVQDARAEDSCDVGGGSGITPSKGTPPHNPYAKSAKAQSTSIPYPPQQSRKNSQSPTAGSSSGKPPQTPAFKRSYSNAEDQWFCYECGNMNFVSKPSCTKYRCDISQVANHNEEVRLGKRNMNRDRKNEVNLFAERK